MIYRVYKQEHGDLIFYGTVRADDDADAIDCARHDKGIAWPVVENAERKPRKDVDYD